MTRAYACGEFASLCDDQDELDESLRWYQETLVIFEQLLPANDENIASTRIDIGLVYHKQGRLDDAFTEYIKATEILRTRYGDRSEHVADCLFNIGRIYQEDTLR